MSKNVNKSVTYVVLHKPLLGAPMGAGPLRGGLFLTVD